MKDMPHPQPEVGPGAAVGARVSSPPPPAGIGPRNFRDGDVPESLSAAQSSISFNMEFDRRRDRLIKCFSCHETA